MWRFCFSKISLHSTWQLSNDLILKRLWGREFFFISPQYTFHRVLIQNLKHIPELLLSLSFLTIRQLLLTLMMITIKFVSVFKIVQDIFIKIFTRFCIEFKFKDFFSVNIKLRYFGGIDKNWPLWFLFYIDFSYFFLLYIKPLYCSKCDF